MLGKLSEELLKIVISCTKNRFFLCIKNSTDIHRKTLTKKIIAPGVVKIIITLSSLKRDSNV
jgi:hypothetical protein